MPNSNDQRNTRKKFLPSSISGLNSTDKNALETAPKKPKIIEEPNRIQESAESKIFGLKYDESRKSTCSKSVQTENIPLDDYNGQQMPSFADLEKMFEDSESNQELTSTIIASENYSNSQQNSQNVTNNNTLSLSLSNKNSNSEIINQFSNNIPQCNEHLTLDSRCCKTNHTVPKIVVCQGPSFINNTTVIDLCDEDDDIYDRVNNSVSTYRDSTRAINEYSSCPALLNNARRFSPLPSTSRDNETIQRNEKHFSDSLCNNSTTGDSQSEVKIIEGPSEIIDLDQEEDHQHVPEVTSQNDQINIATLINNLNTNDQAQHINHNKCSVLQISGSICRSKVPYAERVRYQNNVNRYEKGQVFKNYIKIPLYFYTHIAKHRNVLDNSLMTVVQYNEPNTTTNNNSPCFFRIILKSSMPITPCINKHERTFSSNLSCINTSMGNCPICMVKLSTQVIASTLCGHVFCLKCIKSSLKKHDKKCPKCRDVLGGTRYHMIFL